MAQQFYTHAPPAAPVKPVSVTPDAPDVKDFSSAALHLLLFDVV